MSIGEDRVRIKFNPSDNSDVNTLKQQAATFINTCEEMKASKSGEAQRCFALAMTHAEDAAMWAVKGATSES